MQTYAFILLLALSWGQVIKCSPLNYNTNFHSVYSYEIIVSTVIDGIHEKQFKISSEVDLHPTSRLTYDITFKNVASNELNSSIDQKMVEDLQKLFSVTIIRLPITEFAEVVLKFSDPKESEDVKNLKRGLVALLNVDYQNKNTYETRQTGLIGRCDNEYSVNRGPKIDGQSSVFVTRSRVKDSCQMSKETQEVFSDKVSQGVKSESKSDAYYELIENDGDVYIKNADLEERLSLKVNIYDNLTETLFIEQRLRLISRENHGSNHHLRKRRIGFPKPSFPNLHIPTLPSISSIVNRSKEAISNTVHKVIDSGGERSNLEAHTDFKLKPDELDVVAEKFNHLVDTYKVIESEDVEKLQFGYQYIELRNHLYAADKQYLLDLFKTDKIKAEPRIRRRIFFQVLSLLPQHSAFEAAKEVVNTDLNAEDTVKQFAMDTMTAYFTSRTIQSEMTNAEANEVYQFCKESLTQNRVFLYKACYLYFSRMVSMNHITGHLTLNEVTNFQKNVISDLIGNADKIDDNATPVKLILAIKSVANFRVESGVEFLKKILLNTSHTHFVRVDAAWGLKYFDASHIKDDLMNVLYNQSENSEIRFAIFSKLLDKYGSELLPFVTRIKQNFVAGSYIDDKNLVFLVFNNLKYTLERPARSDAFKRRQENARILCNAIKDDFEEHFEHIPKGYIYSNLYDGSVGIYFNVISSKDSLIPELIYYSPIDAHEHNQYILRSLHSNLLRNLIHKKSTGTPDANIQDAILKMLQQLQLSRKHRAEHTYMLSRRNSNYDIYFIYGDAKNHFYPKDLIAFKGNGIHMKYGVSVVSYTESGLPYFMESELLSLTRILPTNTGLNLLRNTGGSSRSVIFPIISSSHFVRGRLVQETLRANAHVSFHMDRPSNNSFNLNGSFTLLNEGESSTSVYFKSQRFISKILPNDFMSLHLKEVDELNAEDYEEGVTNHGPFQVKNRNPIGKGNENAITKENLITNFRIVGSMITRKNFNYDIKVVFTPSPPNRAFVLNLDFLKDNTELSAKITLSGDTETMYSLFARRTINHDDRSGKCEIVTKDYANSYTTYTTATVQFPNQNFPSFEPSELLQNVKNANVTGAFYTGSDLTAELGKKPEDLYLTFKGTFSKRHNKEEVKYYTKYDSLCKNINDANCYIRILTMMHKYNRLELEFDAARDIAPGDHPVVEQFLIYLIRKYKPHVEVEPNMKTESLKKDKMEINIIKDLREVPTADYSFQRFWGKSTIKDIPELFPMMLFSFSIHEYNFAIEPKLPFYRKPTCFYNHHAIQTFDGYKHNYQEKISCKPKLIVGDCNKYRFFITTSNNSMTVIYNHKDNITFIDDITYLNGHEEDIPVDTLKEYNGFRIMRRIVTGSMSQSVDLGNHLTATLYAGDVIVSANPLLKNQLCGICGNNDGDWSNDLVSAKNEPVVIDKFYDSWSFEDTQKCP